MTGSVAQATFTTGGNSAIDVPGDTLIVPTGTTVMRLTITGLDASNTVKTQMRVPMSIVPIFVDQTTYNADQTNVSVTVVAGQEWRVVTITQQPIRDIRYKMTCES